MTERSRTLDVLRGVAVCGILAVNLPYFALPVLEVEGDLAAQPLADRVAGAVTSAFFTERFVTIFSFLYGAGVVLIARKCERTGLSAARILARRSAALLAFGLAHVALLWYGDILVCYACLGFILIPLLSLSIRTLAFLGSAAVILPPLLLILVALAFPGIPEWVAEQEGKGADAQGQAAAALGGWREFVGAVWEVHPDFETAVQRDGSFARQLALRAVLWLYMVLASLPVFLPRVAGMMLLGMASARSGWILAPAAHRGAFRRCLALGLGIGLPLQAVSTAISLGGAAPAVQWIGEGVHLFASLCTAAGYAGAIGLLCARERPSRLLLPFESLGRLAFTAYILQSALAAALFHGWGAGRFGTIDRAHLWLVVVAIWAIELALATIWLRHARQGPLEALWRAITYGRRRQQFTTDERRGPAGCEVRRCALPDRR